MPAACSRLALAIIGDVIPPRERAKYQGYFMAVFGTSSVLGPLDRWLLLRVHRPSSASAGWRWIFYINVPLGFAALVVVLALAASGSRPPPAGDGLARLRSLWWSVWCRC